MTDLEVSSAVNSILAAFTNGMDVLMRMGARKQSKSKRSPRMTPEELKVHDSLSNRPKQIKSEYAQSVARHGRKFEHGDTVAYSSLAHTLLVLNTGLINIINHALSTDVRGRSKSCQSLLELSEAAGTSTLYALGQLDSRMSVSRRIEPASDQRRDERKTSRHTTRDNSPTRPPPSPLLARGGWVRSKSGSSVVSAATARKLANEKETRRRSKSTSNSTARAASKSSVNLSTGVPKTPSSHEYACLCQTEPNPLKRVPTPSHSFRPPPSYSQERPPSMLLVPADYFREQSMRTHEVPPPRPPKIPVHVRPNPSMRPRPPSAATFLTASTKIGEIPEDRWPDRVLSEDEREHIPLPYVIPPPLESPRKKGRGLKFWKKPERKQVVAAY